VSGLCSPRSALSCGSQRCGRHRTMRICVGCRLPARQVCASSCSLHAQVVHEIGQCLTTIRAVARLHGKTTSFVDCVVASVSTLRLLCVLAMQALRLTVAVLLCYGGAYFIGHTIKPGDLILNCIALEVRSSVPPASLLMCLFSCLVGCVSSLRSACVCFVCGRAPRPCHRQGCAAQCGSALHDAPQSCVVSCAPRGSGVCVACRVRLWCAGTPSAAQNGDAVSRTAWFVRANHKRVRVTVVRARMRAHYANARYAVAVRVVSMRGGIRTLAIVRGVGSLCCKSTSSSSKAARRQGSSARWPSRLSSWWRRCRPSTGWTSRRCLSSLLR
jgi:hypothetical protein